MRKLAVFAFVWFCISASAQVLHNTVTDAATHKPLQYATVLFNHGQSVVYADSSGNFLLNKDSLAAGDSIHIQYSGYVKFTKAVSALQENNLFMLVQQTSELAAVSVSSCRKFKEYVINKRTGSINNYLGPGPETKIIILGRYLNQKNAGGYVKKIELYTDSYNDAVQVPVRLHWYEWQSGDTLPGAELTEKTVILYFYKKGWNSFEIPQNTIYFSDSSLVLGVEFIYPVEFQKQFSSLASVNEKDKWLMDMNNRWSLGMQTTKDIKQSGFYSINDRPFSQYKVRGNGLYIKPAIKFTVSVCKE